MNKLILANHKMLLNFKDIENYLNNLPNNLDNVIFFPSTIFIPYFKEKKLNIGIQNISNYETGNYTGEVSAQQVSSLDISYALVGHSETRNNLNDTNNKINNKIKLCIKNNIIPVLCIGEDYNEYTLNKTKDVIKKELDECLKGVEGTKLLIAYEPIWKIGQDKLLDVNEMQSIIIYIKNIAKNYKFNDIMVLYGGNVNKENINNILNTSIDGVLIGSASTNINEFKKILEVTNK